jgi:hypothetical protein
MSKKDWRAAFRKKTRFPQPAVNVPLTKSTRRLNPSEFLTKLGGRLPEAFSEWRVFQTESGITTRF